MSTAYAHEVIARSPDGFFEIKWPWDPTLIFFLIMGLLYVRGLRSSRRNTGVAFWQKSLFFIGLLILSLAYLPPIDTLSDQLFCMHMLQHLMITSLGVPLLIFGAPFAMIMRGLSPTWRMQVVRPFLRHRLLRRMENFLQRPPIAVLLFEMNFWFWHIPRFYDRALRNDLVHMLEHACLAFTALNLWRLIIDPPPLRSALVLPLRILMLGFMMTMDTALSAGLTYSNRTWYAYQDLSMPDWWKWDHLQDQRLGGLVMWVVGGSLWLLAIGIVFGVWAQRERTHATRNLNG